MPSCPTSEQLAELLTDRLSDAEREILETHLGECPACQGTLLDLAGPAPRASPPAAAPGDEPRRAFLAGLKETLSRQEEPRWPVLPGLEVLEEIGRGSAGIVCKARQRSLDRLVALKVLRDGGRLSPEERAQARRGVEALARLRHPNVVEVYEVGIHDGCLYGVLEYLEGGSLDKQVRGSPWPPRRAAELVRTLAKAVQAVHEQGVIHCDLKPANVLLAADGTPKLADFGLARLLESKDFGRSGDAFGTPGYLAPEQAAGRTRDVGRAADVYGLGAILYEALTGRPPFEGSTRLETLLRVVHEEPVPPSRLRREVPRDLEVICLHCLQKEPRKRYPTARDLAEDLGRFLAGAPIQARRVSILERVWKWAGRHPAVAVLMALLLLVAAASEGIIFSQLQARLQDRQNAEAALEEVEGALYLCRLDLAESRLKANDAAGAGAVLLQCAPAPGRPDRRDPRWYELWQRCRAERSGGD